MNKDASTGLLLIDFCAGVFFVVKEWIKWEVLKKL